MLAREVYFHFVMLSFLQSIWILKPGFLDMNGETDYAYQRKESREVATPAKSLR